MIVIFVLSSWGAHSSWSLLIWRNELHKASDGLLNATCIGGMATIQTYNRKRISYLQIVMGVQFYNTYFHGMHALAVVKKT